MVTRRTLPREAAWNRPYASPPFLAAAIRAGVTVPARRFRYGRTLAMFILTVAMAALRPLVRRVFIQGSASAFVPLAVEYSQRQIEGWVCSRFGPDAGLGPAEGAE